MKNQNLQLAIAVARAMLGVSLFMFVVLTATHGLVVVAQGGFLSLGFVAAMAATSLVAGAAHAIMEGIPAVRTVERIKTCSPLEATASRNDGFRADVQLKRDLVAFVRLVDAMLSPYEIDDRKLAADSAAWCFYIFGYRFRLSAQCVAPNMLRVHVQPLSRAMRYFMLPAEKDGAIAIASVLWRANEQGVASMQVLDACSSEWLQRTVEGFCDPGWLTRRRGRRCSRQ